MKILALTTALTLALAAPSFASNQLATSLGVDGDLYTTAELAKLKSAVESDDRFRIAQIKKSAESRIGGTVSTKSGPSASHAQLAASLGVDGNDYTTAQLAELKSAISDDNAFRVNAVKSRAGGIGGSVSSKSGVSAGHAQLAASLGVNPNDFTGAQLAELKSAMDDDNAFRINAIKARAAN